MKVLIFSCLLVKLSKQARKFPNAVVIASTTCCMFRTQENFFSWRANWGEANILQDARGMKKSEMFHAICVNRTWAWNVKLRLVWFRVLIEHEGLEMLGSWKFTTLHPLNSDFFDFFGSQNNYFYLKMLKSDLLDCLTAPRLRTNCFQVFPYQISEKFSIIQQEEKFTRNEKNGKQINSLA